MSIIIKVFDIYDTRHKNTQNIFIDKTQNENLQVKYVQLLEVLVSDTSKFPRME